MAKGQRRKSGHDVRDGVGKRSGYKHDQSTHKTGRRKNSAQGRRTYGDQKNHSQHRDGINYIEGRRACAEALAVGVPLRRALVARSGSNGETDATLERLLEQVAATGIEIEAVPRARLDTLSSHGAHQGIMLEACPFDYVSLPDLIAAIGATPNALVLVLDHVNDEGNLGAIIRSAEVVGAAGVVIARARAAGVGVGAYKTSAGAVLHMPIARVSNIASAVDELRTSGFWAVAATEHADQSVWEVSLTGRIALVMGSESTGVSRLVRERCDFACRLPQRGHVESLNVAQAATALCYEWLRCTLIAEGDE